MSLSFTVRTNQGYIDQQNSHNDTNSRFVYVEKMTKAIAQTFSSRLFAARVECKFVNTKCAQE